EGQRRQRQAREASDERNAGDRNEPLNQITNRSGRAPTHPVPPGAAGKGRRIARGSTGDRPGTGGVMRIGYSLSSEEHLPRALVEQAVKAEGAGFEFALISDHFHPWTDRQGQSPFVWTTVGAIAVATSDLRVGTGVTC